MDNLTETLKNMVSVYKDILQIALDKKEYIISGDIDKLETVIYRERNLAENILLLEQRRRYVMQSINKNIGESGKPPTLRELIKQVREPYKSEIKKQHETISDIVMKVEEVNKVNTSLTKYSLEYINNFIKSICKESLDDSTYQQSGKRKDPEFKRMMIEVSA